MKTTSKLVSGLAMLAAASAASATDGIANTKHNLGSAGTNNHTNATTEICVFCHTPHGGDQTVSAPIWNRQVNTGGYTRYSAMGTTTFDAAENPIGSVSIACLSCHDGTQAMDVMINTPGSDSTVTLAAGTLGGTGGWLQTNQMSTLKASDNGTLGGDLIFLGTDLRNDHPISMQYAGGGISGATATATGTNFYGDPDYAASVGTVPTAGTSGTNTAIGGVGKVNTKVLASGKRVWWVDTGTIGQQRTDFTLFTRDGTGAVTNANGNNGTAGSGNAVLNGGAAPTAGEQPYVECATCHDPHTTNGTFLRLPGGNQGSQVCLTCHTK